MLHEEFSIKSPCCKTGTPSTWKVALKHISVVYEVAIHFGYFICKMGHYLKIKPKPMEVSIQ